VSGLDFNVSLLEYADLPQYGPGHLLARLRAKDPATAGFPLLERGGDPQPSGSDFHDAAALARILDATDAGAPDGRAGGAGAAVPDKDVRFVTAGQQAGLLTGPLYAFLKAVTAVRLAADLERDSGVRHLPLFWMASEDHDLIEVNRAIVNGRAFTAGGPSGAVPSRRPQVADVPLAPHRAALLEFLEEALPAGDAHRSLVLDMVAQSPFETFATHFQGLMQMIFAGSEPRLLIADPVALRPLTAPVLARLVERWPETLAAFEEGTALLRARGFEPPLPAPGLFEIAEDGARVKVEISPDGAGLSGGPASLDEAAARIRRDPMSFSPNAALRPVLQDAVIPSSACIGGPTELLYLWQIEPVYCVAGVRRSRLWPRITATFLEPKVLRAARKAALSGAGLFDSRGLLNGAAAPVAGGGRKAGELRAASKGLLEILDRLIGRHDDKQLRRGRESLAAQVDKICARFDKIGAEKEGQSRARLETIAAAVLPGGRLQDRAAGVLEFVARHGTAFTARALDRLDPWEIGHLLVEIEPGRRPGAGALSK